MEVTYRRNMSCNYMILQEKEGEYKNTYQIHIFLENQIPGLLPCKIQKINGEELFYYEITGCQKLQDLYQNQKFTKEELEELFIAVVKVLEALQQYLMNGDHLLLGPGYIFRDMEKGGYRFLWFPFSRSMAEKEFRSLTEYILPKIDHGDKQAVTLGYSVYKESMEENIRLEHLKAHLYQDRQEESKKAAVFSREEEEERKKILDEFYGEEEETEAHLFYPARTVVIFILLAAGIVLWLCCFMHIEMKYVLPVEGLLLLAGILAEAVYRKKTGKKESTEAEKEQEEAILYERDTDEEDLYMENREKLVKEADYEGYANEGLTVILGQKAEERACLQAVGKEQEYTWFLEKECVLIGKQKEAADIWLDVPTVSRIHAKIICRGQNHYLVDLNSKNGTLLNGTCIHPQTEYPLQDKDEVVFAETRFFYLK